MESERKHLLTVLTLFLHKSSDIKIIYLHKITGLSTKISGGSRISRRRGANSRRVYVSKNVYVQMKESGPLGARAGCAPLDLPMKLSYPTVEGCQQSSVSVREIWDLCFQKESVNVQSTSLNSFELKGFPSNLAWI